MFLVCLADTVLTIMFISAGRATEANPLMAMCLARGYGFFFVVKMAATSVAIVAAESYRKHNPLFIRRLLQTAITAYVGIYITVFLAVNAA